MAEFKWKCILQIGKSVKSNLLQCVWRKQKFLPNFLPNIFSESLKRKQNSGTPASPQQKHSYWFTQKLRNILKNSRENLEFIFTCLRSFRQIEQSIKKDTWKLVMCRFHFFLPIPIIVYRCLPMPMQIPNFVQIQKQILAS